MLYSGAVNSDDVCLEEPEAELPVTGEGNSAEEQETARHDAPKKPGKPNFWENLSNRVSRIFSTPDEDDSDLI